MRNDEANEADGPGRGDAGTDNHRRGAEGQATGFHNVGSERTGGIMTCGQCVEVAGEPEEDADGA